MRMILCFILLLAVGGCAASLAYTPVPEVAVDRAHVEGYTNIRTWGDVHPPDWDLAASAHAAAPDPSRAAVSSAIRGNNYLALSGGGGDGAYGAGVLVGWTDTGTRPSFDIVTGVSTGALAAPFAFLGPAYDNTLKEVYTSFQTDDLGTPQVFSAVFGGPSLIDASGLERLLTLYVTNDLVDRIAQAHLRGRRLFVATTNVDAERQVVWDLGAIAASSNPDRVRLVRRILLASAAVPGVLPPVLIEVTVNGRTFQEMHADGGTVGQVFFVRRPASVALQSKSQATARLYVIRNGKIGPAWQATEPTILKIANRSLETLIKSQARGDIERLYAYAKSDGLTFHLASIPDTFSEKSEEPFDKAYMRSLFDLGFSEARRGYPWAEAPPR